ncbi:uncharacterized protein ACLA_057520 [Aspergillus clavatus NRRL 1]|uniref:Suppressor protein SRP40 n=1 Tax=Aspergillus clavatus (strain ATCC 1007 / CBS 513.65 / DSM 816 / NCTC 3887 / NRRL 1 / QM 1276 / 107) TaxID=344612 RepID=A1C3V6_ASPCL|nr:uncharacterized protein ACLA_057520 [Aspergillus clavatus NRRL 1]EAW15096.1 hypothetical protein ACLA_057520 [Aspergillus clavatus NRRL 1]
MTTATSETTRLHITPFTPDLVSAVIPASVRPSAVDLSFHCIPTFPENNYGYVTLPTMEADKIKKKLNGSILKGKKFKVEVARSPKKVEVDDEPATTAASAPKPTSEKKSKKRKANDDVLDGYELPADRKVKRGWTESATTKKDRRKDEKKRKGKDEKKAKPQAKSKYTEKSECLFRTNIPKNRSDSPDEKQEKQAKKKKKSSEESVVHEFAKTVTHPSFLRTKEDGAATTSTFEEGKGWVDSAGNLKEPASDRVRKNPDRPGKVAGAKEKRKPFKVPATVQKEQAQKSKGDQEDSADESEDWTSSSGSSSSDDSTDSDSEDSASSTSFQSEVSSSEEEQRQSQSSSTDEQASSPSKPDLPAAVLDGGAPRAQTNQEAISKEVHPLEALFKRSAPESSESNPAPEGNAQFSFFGQDDIESEEDEVQQPHEPQTPFTKKDLLNRELRSAAPTPDTAHVGRTINWKSTDPNMMDIDEVAESSPISKPGAGSKEESDFTKWFWENRGDNNRAWKKRRRDAAKEQRQRENRRKAPASFCKCTCFTNSTIIPLDSPNPEATPATNTFELRIRNILFENNDSQNEKRASNYRSLTCNDCNRKFCLDYDLPMCKGAKEDDVFTTCFQRDSKKDQAIVFIFIIATSGLLAWAACKPWVEKWLEVYSLLNHRKSTVMRTAHIRM